MTSKAIFIAGIHGVGKTTYSERLSQELNLQCFSAGKLIKEFSKNENQKKLVKNLNENQNILLKLLKEQKISKKSYILDGHFCLLNQDLQVQKIPIEIFKELKIEKVILLINSPLIIQNRLNQRDSTKYSLEIIEKLQKEEILTCREYSKELKIKLIEINQ